MGKLFAGLNSKKIKLNENEEVVDDKKKTTQDYIKKVEDICKCLEKFKKKVLEKFNSDKAKRYSEISDIFRDEFHKYIHGHKKLIFNTRTEDVMKDISKKIKSFDNNEVNENNAEGYKKCFYIKFNTKDNKNKLKRSAVDSIKFSKAWDELWKNDMDFQKILKGIVDNNSKPETKNLKDKIINDISNFECGSDNFYKQIYENFKKLSIHFKNNPKINNLYKFFLNSILKYTNKYICEEFSTEIINQFCNFINESKDDDTSLNCEITNDESIKNYFNKIYDKAKTVCGQINDLFNQEISVKRFQKTSLKKKLLTLYPVSDNTMNSIIQKIKLVKLSVEKGKVINTSILNDTFFEGFTDLETIYINCQKKYCITSVSKNFSKTVPKLKQIIINNELIKGSKKLNYNTLMEAKNDKKLDDNMKIQVE